MQGRDLTMLQNICGNHYTLEQSVIGVIKVFFNFNSAYCDIYESSAKKGVVWR